jgi:hypothetical protein
MGTSRTTAPLWAFVALSAVLSSPTSAHAGLAIHGPATYTPGEVITITLTGDSEGRLDPSFAAVIAFSAERGVVTPVAATRGDLIDSAVQHYWIHLPYSGSVDSCGAILIRSLAANECLAVDAFNAYLLSPVPADLLPSTLSTWQFDTTDARGDLLFTLEPFTLEPLNEFDLVFFDLPAATPLVIAGPIPEPVTAALLALGLVVMGVSRRNRRA